uniref:Uncharacterized protein n=1 Tax=Setaria viridis TaxID=4556 RepID=A0A4U6U6U8_SETVI|nr:hypothetical protein SEVIR_6G189100v2 [Setaria viridis]
MRPCSSTHARVAPGHSRAGARSLLRTSPPGRARAPALARSPAPACAPHARPLAPSAWPHAPRRRPPVAAVPPHVTPAITSVDSLCSSSTEPPRDPRGRPLRHATDRKSGRHHHLRPSPAPPVAYKRGRGRPPLPPPRLAS